MLVTRFDPFKEIANIQKALSNFYDEKENGINGFVPRVNTRESEYAYHIEVELPGIKKEDISIELNDNKLIISGERKLKNELKTEDYYKVETAIGKFERVFNLPEDIDIENIDAKSEDGILEITIPKVEKTENKRKIEIK